MSNKVQLILDSGAFSAWKKGVKLDLRDYIKFIHKQQPYIIKAVNLDKIPGSWGSVPSPAEVEASADVSFRNALTIRNEGIDCLPVYHMGERIYWLDKMIGEGFDWIGISPANDRTTDEKKLWLDEVFSHICGNKGHPQIRTHAFGVTALPLIFGQYPWGTIDSTTWLLQPSYGKIIVPAPAKDGSYDFSRAPRVISVSETREGRDPSSQSIQPGEHIKTMGQRERDYVEKFVEDMGFTMARMVEHFKYRCQLSAVYFLEVQKRVLNRPFKPKRETFFSTSLDTPHGRSEAKWPHMTVFFTIPTSSQHSWALTKVKAWNRLITYWYFIDGGQKTFDWKSYVETGYVYVDKPRNGRKQLLV